MIINGRDAKSGLKDWLRAMQGVESPVIESCQLLPEGLWQLPALTSVSYSSGWSHDRRAGAQLHSLIKESRLAESSEPENPGATANRNVVSVLQQEPSFCPKLECSRLVNIYTPEAPLLSWIQARHHDAAVASIVSLTLSHCTYISADAKQQLRNEVQIHQYRTRQYNSTELEGAVRQLGCRCRQSQVGISAPIVHAPTLPSQVRRGVSASGVTCQSSQDQTPLRICSLSLVALECGACNSQ